MKFSLNWAQQYSNVDFKKIDKQKLVEKVGSQLGAVDAVTDYSERYQGIVVVKIVKCQPHPEAEKLQICFVDDNQALSDINRGQDGLIQVVCGGPNATENLYTALIPPGKTVPSTFGGKELVLEAKEIRGQASNGMLASPAELGISQEHDGIIEIKAGDIGREPQPGEALSNLYNLDDLILDIENKMFTHRPDCFGILGVARELAGINGLAYKSPDWYISVPADAFKQTAFAELPLKAENKQPELATRFLAIALSDIKVKDSPYWLQACLSRVGIKPINNVVDTLNYVTHLTGQPMHAFDYDKIATAGSANLQVRTASEKEKLQVLGGKVLVLDKEDLVIAGTKGQAVALAGIIGGAETEVGSFTKNIIIECATFDMYSVRKSSMRHGLFTEAAVRYTKGQSPSQNPSALSYCIEMLQELAGAQVAGELIDMDHSDKKNPTIKVTQEFINARLGSVHSAEEISSLLNNVEIETNFQNSELVCSVPFWRQDLRIKEDIVEEVGRLAGYDNLPNSLPVRSLKPPGENAPYVFKEKLRFLLTKAGLDEFLTYSFISLDLLEAAGQDSQKVYKIKNALSPRLEAYRLSLVPSLLEKVHQNIKLGYKELAYFELGQTCLKDELDEEKVPVQHNFLGVVVRSSENQTGYYSAKQILESLGSKINAQIFTYEPLENCTRTLSPLWGQASLAYEPRRTAVVIAKSEVIGLVGEPSIRLSAKLKLPKNTACFELDTHKLMGCARPVQYRSLNKFPKVTQDITLKVQSDTKYTEVKNVLCQSLEASQQSLGYDYEILPVDIFQPGNEARFLHYSFRISLWHEQRTLTTEEANDLLAQIEQAAKQQLHAERL